MNEKKLKARDFITIGIFTAILWVVQMIIMYLGFLSPFVVAGYSVLIPIATGIPMKNAGCLLLRLSLLQFCCLSLAWVSSAHRFALCQV